jgi:L-ascorbate metabolism protein UlaG (beta-lactamase superfamily)
MKKCLAVLTVLLVLTFLITSCQSTPTVAPTAEPTVTTVTYVGNSGFVIEVGDKKILIDALFDGFPQSYHLPSTVIDKITAGEAPFDDVDLILATHFHDDHFGADMVSQYLANHPDTVFASTAQTTQLLRGFGGRVVTLDAKTNAPVEVDLNGIHVEAIYLTHGIPTDGSAEPINNAYLVSVNGVTLFHTGDIDAGLLSPEGLQGYDLPGKNIDIAFIQHFYLSNPAFKHFMNDDIITKYVIASHYQYTDPINADRIKTYYPDAVIFTEELQTWVMPEE